MLVRSRSTLVQKRNIPLTSYTGRTEQCCPYVTVSLASDCCLLQHQITSDFYITVSYKLNASIANVKC